MPKVIKQRKSADATRHKILAQAEKLFSKHGFSATTTQLIAKTADVHEYLIFHHFTNKEQLWRSVKDYAVNKLNIKRISAKPDTFEQFLSEVIYQRINAYQQNPNLLRLLKWQQLENKKAQLAAGNLLAPNQWLVPIRYLQETKKVNTEIEPEYIMFWLASSINAVLDDDLGFFTDPIHQEKYLNLVIAGFKHFFE